MSGHGAEIIGVRTHQLGRTFRPVVSINISLSCDTDTAAMVQHSLGGFEVLFPKRNLRNKPIFLAEEQNFLLISIMQISHIESLSMLGNHPKDIKT